MQKIVLALVSACIACGSLVDPGYAGDPLFRLQGLASSRQMSGIATAGVHGAAHWQGPDPAVSALVRLPLHVEFPTDGDDGADGTAAGARRAVRRREGAAVGAHARVVRRATAVSAGARRGRSRHGASLPPGVDEDVNRDLLERLYREHGPAVLRRARQILQDEDEARDALQEIAREVLAQLPPPLAEVAVYYYYCDEMTHEEIAAVLGCSRRHVGHLVEQLHRATARAEVG